MRVTIQSPEGQNVITEQFNRHYHLTPLFDWNKDKFCSKKEMKIREEKDL